jgi:predicted anti-sigma-YlaC factor YlaD
MTCQNAAELFPWFLNSSLDEDQRLALEQHLAGCESCRRELALAHQAGRIYDAHLPVDVLLDHAAGETPRGFDRELIARHLASCEPCREDLDLLERGLHNLDRPSVSEPSTPAVSEPLPFVAKDRPTNVVRGPWAVERWRKLALAAGVGFALTSGGLMWQLLQSGTTTQQVAAERRDLTAQLETLERQKQAREAELQQGTRQIGTLQEQIDELKNQLDRDREQTGQQMAAVEKTLESGPRVSVAALPLVSGVEVTRGGADDREATTRVPCAEGVCEALLDLGREIGRDHAFYVLRGADGSEIKSEPFAVSRDSILLRLRLRKDAFAKGPLEVQVFAQGEATPLKAFFLELS